ncbi:hypothetical protein Sste5346_007891 [Sporothrix stenoceras]|uniref:DUF7136 domain-containing protein n=1 Tax=Sporothrix stenoceras TaxID=5173 RepID=A0ABR3YRT6_9PEZI
MSFRRAALMLAGAATVIATTFPQTVEVDVVFPRNETYAPSAVFPIVFAIQNPALAPSLDPGFQFELWQNIAHNNSLDLPNIDLGSTNFTNATGSVYVYTYALNINTTSNGADASTQYNLAWSFSAGNCSASSTDSTEASSFGGGFVFNNVIFTIAKEGGVAPSINTTDSSSCKDLSYLAFNLTGTLTVPDPAKQWDGHSSCAVFSDSTPNPASGNPCAATANASVAASILAGAKSSACAAATPAISCPAKSAAGTIVPMTGRMAGAWALLALAMAL